MPDVEDDPQVETDDEDDDDDDYSEYAKPLKIDSSDMTQKMEATALNMIAQAVSESENKVETDIAQIVRKKMDEIYGGYWQCIIGKIYGCNIKHDMGHFLFGYYGETGVLLFRTT